MTAFHDLSAQAETLLALCRTKGLRLATVESCTGGLIAAILTEIPGSSDVFDRGFVTYSNEAKADMLGVPSELIEMKGAVSEEVAAAMATGALAHSLADLTVSVTGVAGPGGGTQLKPVGLVCLAVAGRDLDPVVHSYRFDDIGRSGIRLASVKAAYSLLSAAANGLERPKT